MKIFFFGQRVILDGLNQVLQIALLSIAAILVLPAFTLYSEAQTR